MNRRQLLAVVFAVLLVVPGSVSGVVRGSPELEVTAPSNEFVVGANDQLTLTLVNEGNLTKGSATNPSLDSEVTTARGVEVRLDPNGAPVDVTTGTRSLGGLAKGESANLDFGLNVAPDAEPGTYTMEATVTFRYTGTVSESPTGGARSQQTETETFDVTVEIEDRARFEVVSTETDARIGSTGTVSVRMRNVGSEAATDTTVALESQNTDLSFGESATASRYVGEWGPGETRTIEYQVTAAPGAEQQRYSFQATATFDDAEGVTRQPEALPLSIRPQSRQEFSIVDTESSLAVGDTGTVSVTLRNDGPVPASAATVQLQSGSCDVVFGRSASATRFVGEWAPGETRTVVFDATANDSADTRSYSLTATVNYDDPRDNPARSRQLSLGVTPAPEQGFSLSNVESTLRVGEERSLSGTITNDGQQPVRDVVVRFTTQNQNLNPGEREYSVGTLEPGESADFEYSVAVSDAAGPGERQFAFVAEYRNSDGDRRRSDDLLARAAVEPQQDAFSVQAVDATVSPQGTERITVEVTNAGDEPVSAVSAKLFADDPLSAEDDEAFVQSLDPGESTELVFTVSATGAIEKSYPLSMDFQYDDADGDTLVTDTYRVSVQVQERQQDSSGGPPLAIVGAVVLVVTVIAGYVYYTRR
jgi:hypothetical protein